MEDNGINDVHTHSLVTWITANQVGVSEMVIEVIH